MVVYEEEAEEAQAVRGQGVREWEGKGKGGHWDPKEGRGVDGSSRLRRARQHQDGDRVEALHEVGQEEGLGVGVARKPKHEVVEAWGQRWGRKKHVRKREEEEEEEEEEQTHEKHEESGHGAKKTDGVDGDEKERAETRDEH